MRRWIIGVLTAAFGLLNMALLPVLAVQPDEILDDPVLEERARELSAELRCMVCQNQSIDDSDAELARDLRILVRDRLKAGDSNEEVIAYVVDRYGEFVLLKPRFSYRNALLWGAPVILLLVGGVLIVTGARRKKTGGAVLRLSAEEKKRLDQILNDRE
ncbi:cytochrome c-type biogenesis protein CcmH [Nitratireductor sp. B36]|uniref:cytochrome c-type biogenesis protein n=1 Tax=Nitratireductor sp. B36 TaxID=2762059 RepID=UPI001E611368|nr:cytochrome c-type biogenesis protein [Nitratireductor sp. B36]MCC5778155.1 cytochrome c-type biogenesis protein CcmH [Nitratireductor sp. B36]